MCTLLILLLLLLLCESIIFLIIFKYSSQQFIDFISERMMDEILKLI